jgi:hypothetical protein
MRPEIVGFKVNPQREETGKGKRGLRTKSRVLINIKDCSIELQTLNLPSLPSFDIGKFNFRDREKLADLAGVRTFSSKASLDISTRIYLVPRT